MEKKIKIKDKKERWGRSWSRRSMSEKENL